MASFRLCIEGVSLTNLQQDQTDDNRQRCAGMYSRQAWGGDTSPFILIKFMKPEGEEHSGDPIVSLVMFEWGDEELIGVYPTADSMQVWLLCCYIYPFTFPMSAELQIPLFPVL